MNKLNSIDGHIVVAGPRPSGKITYLTTLAYFPNANDEARPVKSVEVSGYNSETLIFCAENILKQGLALPAPIISICENLYCISIALKPNNHPLNIIGLKRNTKININCTLYAGETFDCLIRDTEYRFNRTDYEKFINDCLEFGKVAILIDACSNNRDKEYAAAITQLQHDLVVRLNKIYKPKCQIAVVFTLFERPEAYIYRKQLNRFISLKFPQTKQSFTNLSENLGCSVAYFPCSAYGIVGNPPQPNSSAHYGGIKHPDAWKPFGLVAPIYWLLTGKYDERLLEI